MYYYNIYKYSLLKLLVILNYLVSEIWNTNIFTIIIIHSLKIHPHSGKLCSCKSISVEVLENLMTFVHSYQKNTAISENTIDKLLITHLYIHPLYLYKNAFSNPL